MDLNLLLKEKKEKNILIKKRFWLLQKNKALWLIKITNKALLKELRDWLVSLPVSFIIEIDWVETDKLWENIVATWKLNENDLIAFDFVICDDNTVEINKYLEYWITPIISNDSHMKTIFKEFNPLKNEWNSFKYEKLDKWSIFYTLVRYLENYKFPFDNKNLVKNVLSS